LDAAKQVNIYGSSGPVPPTITKDIGGSIINFNPIGTPQDGKKFGQVKPLTLTGSISFSPPTTDPRGVGSVTLAASARRAFINLSGSTLIQFGNDEKPNSVKLSLTGNGQFTSRDYVSVLGFSPKLNLTGVVKINPNTGNYDFTSALVGLLTPDGTSNSRDTTPADAYSVTLTPPIANQKKGNPGHSDGDAVGYNRRLVFKGGCLSFCRRCHSVQLVCEFSIVIRDQRWAKLDITQI